ncbi:MAG TPA: allantoinase AllB [Pyrinomonadaceae bacterium]|jgi:allantoinase|nr:allantoinase AllB [Pyrinomonadaceae bacterium]
MPAPNLVIRSSQVVLPDAIAPASVHIVDDKIVDVCSYDRVPEGCELIESKEGSLVMAGLVDSHVHINEPGRTEWEGFASATRAAAAGGVTTLIDMPLNSIPPTTTLAGLQEKLAAARDQCSVDVGFWGGVVPGNTSELAALQAAGVVGFKCFLIHSGVEEFPNVTEDDLRTALPELARLGALMIVHAEVPGPISRTGIPACPSETAATATGSGVVPISPDRNVFPTRYKTFLASRPRAAEDEAVALMIKLSREFGVRVHIVHHSSADSLALLRAAKSAGLGITAETCPHYLTFAAEEIADGATEFKCCPPIRERENREQLWNALGERTIDFVVSDHSPCPPEMKLRESGDFLQAWGGISSLQLRLPIVWTEANRRGFSLQDVARWLCEAPARLVGLAGRKGLIASGYDADLVIWDPIEQFKVAGQSLQHRHKLTPYQDLLLAGVVEKTFLRGRKIYDCGKFSGAPRGEFLL